MATVTFDEIEGASLQTSQRGIQRRVRRARIRGIDVVGTPTNPDARVLEKALELLPPIGDPYPPGDGADIDGLVLRQHFIQPRRHNICVADLIYESPTPGGYTPGSYLIRSTTRLVQEQTNMIPGTRIPIRVSWQDEFDPEIFVPEDYLTIQYEKAFRTVVLSATIYGDPPTVHHEMVGRVNDATWYGYPKGYWRISHYNTDTDDRGASYQVTAELESKLDEDWSIWGILQNRNTGRFVKVLDTDVETVMALPYIYGITLLDGKGFAKVGPHKLANFSTLFFP